VAKFGGEVAAVIDEHRDYFESRPNLKAVDVFRNYLEFDRLVESNPEAAILQLAASTKTDLYTLLEKLSGGEFNPREAVLQHQLSSEKRAREFQTRQQREFAEMDEEEQQAYADQQQHLQFQASKIQHRRTIDTLAPTLPDFKELEPDIAAIIPHVIKAMPGKSPEEHLKEAHARARRANPVTFAKMQKEAAAKSSQARSEATERTNNARLASRINIKGTNGAGELGLKTKLDAAWDRGMARHNNR
jgi:hypothetical protein